MRIVGDVWTVPIYYPAKRKNVPCEAHAKCTNVADFPS